MASGDSVGKLRQALDAMSTKDLDYPTPDLGYYEAVLQRLDYKFSERMVSSGNDEAVRVITPEEWSLANQARAAAQERQQELEQMQEHLRNVQGREDDLNRQIQELRDQLDEAKRRREELIPLEFVGVRGVLAPEQRKRAAEMMEFEEEPVEEPEWAAVPATATAPAYAGPESLAWEETGEAPVPPMRSPEQEAWQPVEEEPIEDEQAWPSEDAEADDQWQVAPEPEPDTWQEAEPEQEWEPEPEAEPDWEIAPVEPRVQPPPGDDEAQAVEEEIRKIEDEIRKIEEELALIAAQERELESRGARPTEDLVEETGGPYRTGDYTLFVKQVENPDGSTRPFYFFSKETARDDAEPSDLPGKYDVAVNARTSMPYLKRKADEGE